MSSAGKWRCNSYLMVLLGVGSSSQTLETWLGQGLTWELSCSEDSLKVVVIFLASTLASLKPKE